MEIEKLSKGKLHLFGRDVTGKTRREKENVGYTHPKNPSFFLEVLRHHKETLEKNRGYGCLTIFVFEDCRPEDSGTILNPCKVYNEV